MVKIMNMRSVRYPAVPHVLAEFDFSVPDGWRVNGCCIVRCSDAKRGRNGLAAAVPRRGGAPLVRMPDELVSKFTAAAFEAYDAMLADEPADAGMRRFLGEDTELRADVIKMLG